MKNVQIKYAIEEFVDIPETYNDEDIDRYMKKLMFNFFISNIIWCHNDEKLFDDSHMCKTFVATPIKKGYIRIKYASEQTQYVPYSWDKYRITDTIKHIAEHQNGHSFIWCYGDKKLFKED